MKQLVIGLGQVGSALKEVLQDYYRYTDVDGIDAGDSGWFHGQFDVIHVCFPWSDKFHDALRAYKKQYLADDGLVIIHSSVPVGTSALHGAVHSPIRGVHPNLSRGIRTFVKYFGGPRAVLAAQIFAQCGIMTVTTRNSDQTEALKLWDTTYYGWNIIFEKAVKQYCDEHGLDFNLVYTHANRTYNEGYLTLGMENVLRPVLEHREGPIGGHCVIPNARLLDSSIAQTILGANYHLNKEALA